MIREEVTKWLQSRPSVRFKHLETDLLYDVMIYNEETVLLHQCGTENQVYVLSLEDLCNDFEESWSAQ